MLRRLLASLVLVSACSARDIEEEGQSRRHLAAQWCEAWCTFWYDCEPLYAGSPDECRERYLRDPQLISDKLHSSGSH